MGFEGSSKIGLAGKVGLEVEDVETTADFSGLGGSERSLSGIDVENFRLDLTTVDVSVGVKGDCPVQS